MGARIITVQFLRLESGSLRDDEINKPVFKEHVHEMRTMTCEEPQLDSRQKQNDEVEAHGVYEGRGEDRIICLRYGTTLTRHPCGFEKDTWRHGR